MTLALGVQPPTPSWGNMLAEAQSLTTLESMPYLWVPPGLAIAVLSFATHLVFQYGEEHFHIQFALFPQYAILFALGC